VPACRRVGVHAPDIKEEFEEFKEFEEFEEFEEYWRGAAFARAHPQTHNICCLAQPDRKLWTSRRLPGATQRLATLSPLRTSHNP
jgi:hypothetical protein